MVIQRELDWLKANERYQFFEPNAKAESFIKLAGTETDYPIVFSAANGTSKTATVVNLLANLIWPGRNKWFDFERFRSWPYPKRVRYITDPELVKEIGPFHQEIVKWWPRGQWRGEKANKGYFSQYHANGWVVDVLTYDQDVKQFEGGTLGLIIMDEPAPQSIYNACIGRLRLGGLLLVVMTPLTHAAWFYDQIVPKIPERIIYADIEDACIQHGVRGHLEHANIQRMMDNWPEEEIEARAHGRAMYLRGLIFKTFDPKVHVLREPIVCPPHTDCWQIVDPHDDKPFAVTYAFPDARGDLYIVDEWPNEDFYRMHNCQLTVDDYIKIFRDKEQGWHMGKRIMDRRFGEVSHTSNRKTLRDEFQEKGLLFEQSYSALEEIETGILRVRQKLAYDTSKPISNLNHPKLYINPKCINTIKSLTNWARDPDTGKVQEAYKDFCDNLRYFVMADPRVSEPIQRTVPNRYG